MAAPDRANNPARVVKKAAIPTKKSYGELSSQHAESAAGRSCTSCGSIEPWVSLRETNKGLLCTDCGTESQAK